MRKLEMNLTSLFTRRRRTTAPELVPYVIGPKIGEGGAGVVYRARHRTMTKSVAIKMLAADRSDASDRWSAVDALAWWNAHRPYCLAD